MLVAHAYTDGLRYRAVDRAIGKGLFSGLAVTAEFLDKRLIVRIGQREQNTDRSLALSPTAPLCCLPASFHRPALVFKTEPRLF